VQIRIYDTKSRPTTSEFEMVLQPGVWHGSVVGRSSAARSFVPEVTPVDPVGAVVDRFVVQPEFDGSQWNDVFRISTRPGDPVLRVQVRLYEVTDRRLAVYCVLPTDIPYDPDVHNRLIAATRDIQAWYQCASGGVTWRPLTDEIVQIYYAQRDHAYYRDHGNWWGSLLGEMAAEGYPVWKPGYVAALWAQGAGWWAGAAQSCDGDCGVALLGVEIFPEFNNPNYSGGECPGGEGAAAWPCTPEGAFAHELGHTLGLPHPDTVPDRAAYANHSVMQTHWNYPDFAPASDQPWGFLSLERASMWPNAFMVEGISLNQMHEDCDVVNLPSTGEIPEAAFSYTWNGPTVEFTNESQGASRYYWTFGDGAVSNEIHPEHTYAGTGPFTVRLRASNPNGMIGLASESIGTASETTEPEISPSASIAVYGRPNPFTAATAIEFESQSGHLY
jgi:hypothetical protein